MPSDQCCIDVLVDGMVQRLHVLQHLRGSGKATLLAVGLQEVGQGPLGWGEGEGEGKGEGEGEGEEWGRGFIRLAGGRTGFPGMGEGGWFIRLAGGRTGFPGWGRGFIRGGLKFLKTT